MRTDRIGAIFEVGAIVVLVLIGVRAGRQWHAYSSAAEAEGKTMDGGMARKGTILGSLGGVDLAGETISPPPDANDRVVMFLLRGRSARADLAFWNHVGSDLGGHLLFRGFCEKAACALAGRKIESVLLLRAGAARTVEGVVQADQRGEALVIGARLGKVLGAVSWRHAGPARVAAELAGVH
ncbi:MAG: hypothetical protein ACRD04_06255 [Terriglobales bacterium]